MEVMKASIIYLISLIAAHTLKLLTPIKFEDKDCESSYTTRIDKGNVTYVVTVKQWCMISKTQISIFNSTTKYYISDILILLDGKTIGTNKLFFPEPVKGIFKRTKLPHAVIALATLEKLSIKTDEVCITT